MPKKLSLISWLASSLDGRRIIFPFVTIYIYIYMDPFGLRGQEGGEVEESRIELTKNRLIFF